jgi:hypothetical protein
MTAGTAGATDIGALGWLDHHRGGAAPDAVLEFFDGLPAVGVPEMLGRWRGSELPTGSPLDGLLAAYGWWGKEFLDPETVHPLLFAGRGGRPYPVNPALVPIAALVRRPGLARAVGVRRVVTGLRPLGRTARPTARLREVEHRGVVSAAMVYDAVPVVDVFRRIADGVVLGLMDMRGLDTVFPFVLRREG